MNWNQNFSRHYPLKRIMFHILRIIVYFIAVVPILFMLSMLEFVIPAYLLSLIFPDNIMMIMMELITISVLVVYYFFYKGRIDKRSKIIYYICLISTPILYFIFDYRFVIVFQLMLLSLYVLKYTPYLSKVKERIAKSIRVLAFMSIYDGIICGCLLYFLYHLDLVESKLKTLHEFLTINWRMSERKSDIMIYGIVLFVLPLIISIVKTKLAITIFKKRNGIVVPKDKTLWNAYVSMIATSFLWYWGYLLYSLNRIANLKYDLLVDIVFYIIFISLYILFWFQNDNRILNKGDNRKGVVASWLSIILGLLLLALFNQVESEVINVLTWFLPILIPSLIGEVNSQYNKRNYPRKPRKTEKMEKHLYSLQLYSFLTLVLISLFPRLIEAIWKLDLKMELVRMIINTSNDWLSGFYASFIIVGSCFLIALITGKILIWLLTYFYLNPSKGYFEFKNNIHNAISNRKYKRNIHKRRDTHV